MAKFEILLKYRVDPSLKDKCGVNTMLALVLRGDAGSPATLKDKFGAFE